MVLRLRKVHTFRPLYMEADDELHVKVTADILIRMGEKVEAKTPIVRELINYDGIINTCITADILYNGEHRGITVFIGHDLTTEMCGITLPPPEGVIYDG